VCNGKTFEGSNPSPTAILQYPPCLTWQRKKPF